MMIDTDKLRQRIEQDYDKAVAMERLGDEGMVVQRRIVALDTIRDNALSLLADVEFLAKGGKK